MDTDITGTVNLLEAAAAGRDRFIIYLLPMVINDIPPPLVAIVLLALVGIFGRFNFSTVDDMTETRSDKRLEFFG